MTLQNRHKKNAVLRFLPHLNSCFAGIVRSVANRLNLSLHTVETHRWRVMEKMGLYSIAELVLSAVRRGVVT